MNGRTSAGRERTEELPGRLTRLARVTSELVTADGIAAVSRVVVASGAEAVGADLAIMTLLSDDGRSMYVVGLPDSDADDMDTWMRFPIAARTPTAESIRTGRRLMVTGAEEISERFPDMAPVHARAVLVLPLNVGPRTIGAIGLVFGEERVVGTAELDFLEILADTCAQALERVTAQRAATTQRAKLAFLADAATELASSLDYEVTLSRVARLAVPTFADWCAIDVLDSGRLHRVAVAHVDPDKVQLAHEVAERFPADPDAPRGALHVVRTGVSELIPDITDDMLVAASQGDPERLRVTRELHLRSALTVPLVVRGAVLGVLTWVAAESERRFTEEDLALAEDLAKRAAVALDNSDLYSQTRAVAVQLQRAVLPDSMPELAGWELAAHYSPAGRTEVGGDFYDVITLHDGRLALFVGDVMGRGVGAAAAMAQIRAAVRAYAAVDPAPATVLANLDQMYAQFPTEQLVTLVYLVADPARDELVVANAGHPPPVVLRRDGSVEQLPLADGAPLGVGPLGRRQTTMALCGGDTVVAFTDGLIERRKEDITDGQARLVRAIGTLAGPDLVAALDQVVAEVAHAAGDDDVAVLAARRTPAAPPA